MATITKRGSRWQAEVRRNGYPNISKTFDVRADAVAWARAAETEQDRSTWIDPSESLRTTLKAALLTYEREISQHKKGYAQERSILHRLGKHRLSAHALGRIRAADVAAYRDERLAKVQAATVNRELALISHVFTIAIKEWRMENLRNPVTLIRKPRLPRGRDRRPAEASPDGSKQGEIEAIISATQSVELPPILLFSVETAMRRSEMASLRWDQVNLPERTIHLRDTKNGDERLVPLSTRAVELLRGLPRRIDGRVFSMTPKAITRAFIRARNRAGIQDLRLHDMRHEATSRLFEVYNMNPLEAATVTGHRDLRMLARYTHIAPSILIRKMDDASGKVAPKSASA